MKTMTRHYITLSLLIILSFLVFFSYSDCEPPCFNAAHCNEDDKCECPVGFKGSWCEELSCGKEIDSGKEIIDPDTERLRKCECNEGWTGANCRVCQTDEACQKSFGTDSKCIQDNWPKDATVYHTCVVKPPYSLMLSENVTLYCDANEGVCKLETFHTWDLDKPHPFLTEIFFCQFKKCEYHEKEKEMYEFKCEETKCGCRYCPDAMKPIVERMEGKASVICENSSCKLKQEKLFMQLGMTCSPTSRGGCTKSNDMRRN